MASSQNAVVQQFKKGIQAMLGLILITILFMALAPTYRQVATMYSIMEQTTVLLIMATGTTVVLISGGLDLSVGSILALVTCVVGDLMATHGAPVWVAIAAGLLVGMLCGFLNGFITVSTGVPPFIVTLGMMGIAKGVALMVGQAKDMSRFPESFTFLGFGHVVPVVIAIGMVILVAFLLTRTKFGFNAFAIGGNEEVARLSGIPVKRYQVLYYTLGGFTAAMAAIVQTARFDFASPNRGEGWELLAISAVVIGGTSLFGGVGGVGRTVIGALIIKSLEVGLIHCRVGSFWQRVAIGIVIIVAVWLDRFQRRQKV